jgi:hypothetical protein
MAQVTEKLLAPCRRTFWSWPKVTGFPCAGETKAHGHNGYPLRVVKDFACHSHPFTQTISAGIIERYAGFMNFSSGSLTRNQHPCLRVYLKDGSNPMRQMRCANGARANLC